MKLKAAEVDAILWRNVEIEDAIISGLKHQGSRQALNVSLTVEIEDAIISGLKLANLQTFRSEAPLLKLKTRLLAD